MKRKICSAILVVSMVLAVPALGLAALTAPNWMPGSPILAGNQVILLWTPVPGAVKYAIYMNGKKIQDSVSIQAIVQAPDEAGTYEFQVAAIDPSSAEGAKSSPGVVKIFKLVSPKGLEARLIGKNVAVHWDPVGGAVLYNVYRSTESGKNFNLVDSIQDVRWTDSKVEENKKYYYRITAKDASGKESPQSPEILVSTEVATAVTSRAKNVTGKKTKPLAMLTDKDIAEAGIVRIFEPYDIEPSPNHSRYYISSVNTKAVLIMDADGKYLGQFGNGDPKTEGTFLSPYGIGVGPDGRVYVADSKKNNVQVFSSDGVFEKVFVTVTRKKWMTDDPQLSDVDIDPDGNVYVLEYRHGAVIKYNSAGQELSHFTKRGPGKDETGFLALFKFLDGKLYLGDGARGRVMITNQEGKTLKTIGEKGVGVGLLQGMGGFDVTDGKVFVVDRSLGLVQVYNLVDGEYLFTLANEDNTSPMPLMGPKAIAVDGPKQRVFVAQGIINQIRSFEMFGKAEEAKGGK